MKINVCASHLNLKYYTKQVHAKICVNNVVGTQSTLLMCSCLKRSLYSRRNGCCFNYSAVSLGEHENKLKN